MRNYTGIASTPSTAVVRDYSMLDCTVRGGGRALCTVVGELVTVVGKVVSSCPRSGMQRNRTLEKTLGGTVTAVVVLDPRDQQRSNYSSVATVAPTDFTSTSRVYIFVTRASRVI